MHINLGTREIYNYSKSNDESREVWQFCREDSQESVEKYKIYYQAGCEDKFLNGCEACRNILMQAASCANVYLVKYIVENADPKILDMRDNLGFSALHFAVTSSASRAKVMECTRMLIQAGANIYARCTFRDKYFVTNFPTDDKALDEKDLIGENPLGYLVRQLTNQVDKTVSREKERWELLTELFIAHGVTSAYVVTFCHGKYLGWCNIDDEMNQTNMCCESPNCTGSARKVAIITALREARQRVHNKYWSKMRMLSLGLRDPGSPLSNLTIDLQILLGQKIAEN